MVPGVLGLGECGLDLFEAQLELIGIELLGSTAKPVPLAMSLLEATDHRAVQDIGGAVRIVVPLRL